MKTILLEHIFKRSNYLLFLLLLFSSSLLAQKQSATDSVLITTVNSTAKEWGRGFEFKPKYDILVTDLGLRALDIDTFAIIIWDVVAQKKLHQIKYYPSAKGVYEYSKLAASVFLNAGKAYSITMYSKNVGYYYGSSTQINKDIAFLGMRYCNSCYNNLDFPTQTLNGLHYGTPDFLFVKPGFLVAGNGSVIANSSNEVSIDNFTDFGDVYQNDFKEHEFDLLNNGEFFEDTVVFRGSPTVSISGANASDFKIISQPSVDTLFSLDTTKLKIKFSPQAVGLREAFVTITYNDSILGDNEYKFKISGTGKKPLIKIDFSIANKITCFGFDDGAILAAASSGIKPYTFEWDNADTARYHKGLTAGYHVLTVTDSLNNKVVDSFYIAQPKKLQFTGESVVYDEQFVASKSYCQGDSQYDNWLSFRASLNPNIDSYSKLILSGSELSKDIVLEDEVAIKSIATALKNGQNAKVLVNGVMWSVAIGCKTGCTTSGDDIELNVDFSGKGTACGCGSNPTLRPCIGNDNWGGFGGVTCGASSQNMRVEFVISGVSISHVNCFEQKDGEISLQPFGGTKPYSFNWSISSTDSFVTNLDTGIYAVVVSDNNNCVLKDTFKISQPELLVAQDIVIKDVSCFGLVDGTAKAFAKGGTFPYSYKWSNGDSTETIYSLKKGRYLVTISDINGCTDTISAALNEPDSLVSTITINNSISCFGSSDGEASIAMKGGTAPFNYFWDHTSVNNDTISGLDADTFTVKVIDANGCGLYDTVIFNQPDLLKVFATIDSNAICNGTATGGLTAYATGGTVPYLYTWSNTDTNRVQAGVVAGNYTVVVSDSNACVDSAKARIDEPSKIIAGVIQGDTTVCAGVVPHKLTEKSSTSGGFYSSSRVIPLYTYQWQISTDSINWSDISGADTLEYQPSEVFVPTWFRRLDSNPDNCGPFASNVVKIDVYAQPFAGFKVVNACEGQQATFTNQTKLDFGTIKSYNWDFGDNGVSSQENPINVYKSTGTYTVKLSVLADGGCSSTTSQTVTINAMPKVNFSASTVCEGISTSFSNSSKVASGTMTYNWSLGDKNSTTSVNPKYTYQNAGFYTVQLVALTNGACTDSITKTVQVKQVAKPNFSATNVCLNESTSFTNLSTNAKSSSWDFGNSQTSTLANPTVKYAASGSYKVILSAISADGCSDTAQRLVHVYTLPSPAFSATEVCLTESTIFSNSTSGTHNYQWIFGNGTSSNKENPKLVYAKAGTYDVELTATSLQGCKATANKQVVVNALPNVSFSTTDVCLSDALNTNNTTTGASTYKWFFGDASTSTLIAPSHNYTQHGNYTIRLIATSAKACIDSSKASIKVFAEPKPAFTANNECFGTDVNFINNSTIANGTLSYKWFLGDGNTSGNAAPSYAYAKDGSYQIKLVATSNQGCMDSVAGAVVVYPMPTAQFTTANVCYGDTLFVKNNSTVAKNFKWTFGDGNSASTLHSFNFYKRDGNYDIQLIASTNNNCVDSIAKSISIYAKPIASFTAQDVCDKEQISFVNTSYGAIINANSWTFGDGNTSLVSNPKYTYSSAATYTATLICQSNNACSDTVTKSIVVNPNPEVSFTYTEACEYDSTVFSNTSSIANGSMQFTWDFGTADFSNRFSPAYQYGKSGAYRVALQAISDKGCTGSSNAAIKVNPSPKAVIDLNNNCEGEISYFVSNSTIDGGTISNHLWSFGDGNGSSNNNPSYLYAIDGEYNVRLIVTSSKSCVDTSFANMSIYNKPTADFSSDDVCFGELSIFKNNSVDAADYLYDFGDKWGISTNQAPEYRYEDAGTYSATLFVTSALGCKDTLSKNINIFSLPVAQFSVNNHCFEEDFTPIDKSSGSIDSWNWEYGNGENANGIDPIYTYPKDGQYTVKLTIVDNNSCIDSLRKELIVYPLPKVWISNDTLVSKGYTVPLLAKGGVAYKWSPVEDLYQPLQSNPIATVIEDVRYTVTVANEFGCIRDTFVNLRVQDDYTLEPSNIITPDGNGQNDYWIVEKAQYYNDVEVLVFDRWGRMVYQSKNYDNSWAGVSSSTGKALPDGAYYYVIKVPAEREEYKGSITIFR